MNMDSSVGFQKKSDGAVPKRRRKDKSCRATGCQNPLDGARSEKVRLCLFHQRELEVESDGQMTRFCQQCMRLHELSKFDGNKRSCRARLKLQSERRFRKIREALEGSADQPAEPGTASGSSCSMEDKRRNGTTSDPAYATTSNGTASPFPKSFAVLGGQSYAEEAPRHRSSLTSSFSASAEGPFSIPDRPSSVTGPLCAVTSSQFPATPAEVPPQSGYIPNWDTCSFGDNVLGGAPLDHKPAAVVVDDVGPYPPLMVHAAFGTPTPMEYCCDNWLEKEQHILSISFKVYGATPEDLPPNLFEELLHLLQRSPKDLEGALRPGCLMLSVDCVMPNYADYATALESFKVAFEGSLTAGGSLWATHDTDIRLPDSLIQVRNGSIVGWSEHASDIVIRDVEPLAAAPGEEVWLQVAGLKEGVPFKVLCRNHGRYLELGVHSVELQDDGTAMVVIDSTPVGDGCGFAMLEVLQEDMHSMNLSASAPLLLMGKLETAREISTIKEGIPSTSQLHSMGGMLKAIGAALHPAPYCSPSPEDFASAACTAALQGWYMTLEEILCTAYTRQTNVPELMVAAMGRERNLLLASIVSGCSDTVRTVLELLEHEDLLPLVTRPDAAGQSPMDVVIAHGDASIAEIFAATLARLDSQRQASLPTTDTPGTTDTPTDSSEGEPRDLRFAHCVMAALSGKTVVAKATIPVVYALLCSNLCMEYNPLAWLTLLLAFFCLHVLLPKLFYHHFLPHLERVQALAGQRGLLVSSSLELLDAAENERYQRFALQRTTLGVMGDSCLVVMVALAVTSRYLHTLGLACCVAPQLSFIFALLVLRGFAVSTGRRTMKQCTDICLELCILLADSSPQLYAWVTGNPQLCAVPKLLEFHHFHGRDWLLAIALVAILACKFCVTKALLGDKPLFAGVILSDVATGILAHSLFGPTSFCIASATGHSVSAAMLSWGLVVNAFWAILHVALLIMSESRHLHDFLTVPVKGCAEKQLYSVGDCCAMLLDSPLGTH